MSTALAQQSKTGLALTALIDRATMALTNSRTAAEVLEARDMASDVYDAAKKAARLGKAKGAADDLIKTAYRVQADALDIEATAKRRLADEYDAAQSRGEVAKVSDGRRSSKAEDLKPTAADLGLSHKDIHESRMIRDAEQESPGIIRQALDAMLKSGEEPTKAKVRRTVLKAPKRKKPNRKLREQSPQESRHDLDLRMLMGVWEAACDSARNEFLKTVTENTNG